MMRIFLNGLGANTASGLTYLRNVLVHLGRWKDVHTTVAVIPKLKAEFAAIAGIDIAELPCPGGALRRFWFEQRRLPEFLQRTRADVLISAGNFALRKCPVPQILLSGNSLYISRDFYRDLLSRGEYAMWLNTRVRAAFARQSIHWADCTVAPTCAFAEDLERWSGRPVITIRHGFDRDIFFAGKSPLPENVRLALEEAQDALRLLYVSHYNYFRNFETLLRAVPVLRQRLRGRKLRVFLTCKLAAKKTSGSYDPRTAAALVKQLGICDEIVELGEVPYRCLHQLYSACHVYVSPSYAETFAHPLVEARACGLPLVVSDLPVHREVCGDAALYFSRFSHEQLAECILRSGGSRTSGSLLRDATVSVTFSWRAHVQQILLQAARLTGQDIGVVEEAIGRPA